MSSSRLTIIGVAVIVVVAVALSLTDADDGAELVKKIDSLEQRIISLEKTLNTRLAAIEKGIGSGGGAVAAAPDAAAEGAAQTEYGEINKLVTAGDYDQAKARMSSFMKTYGATNTAKQAQRLDAELAVIGKNAPASWDIEKWYQGESDIDLAGDGTKLLVFWEVWCPHCKREVPKLEQIYSNFKGQGLQVVGLTKVNRSATDEGVKGFIKETSVTYPMAKETGTLSSFFGVSGVPAAAVVKDGKVVWRGHPARLSDAMLKGWL